MNRIAVAIGLGFVLCSLPTKSQQLTYRVGDWIVHKELPGIQVANVSTQDGKATAGIICFLSTNECVAYVLSRACYEINSTIPMMINSPVGAFHITTRCEEVAGTPPGVINVINEFGNAKAAFESGGEVGFVLPLQSGEFRAVRFSTKGAVAAIESAMTPPQAAATPRRTDDEIL